MKELVARAKGGDEAAFEQLVTAHEKKIYALCLRMCENEEDAQEAAQDAFLAAWTGLSTFREDAAFSTWLYRLAVNACTDILRRRKRRGQGVSLDDEEIFLEIEDTAPTPERALEQKETVALVGEALDALPSDYRQVLVLRELHQLSYQEISEITSLELGTVKSRISRGRTLMRNYLMAAGNFFEKYASKDVEKESRQKRSEKNV